MFRLSAQLTEQDLQKIADVLERRGFGLGRSIPSYSVPTDFSNLTFQGETWFTGFLFLGKTNFDNARFESPVVFSDACFEGVTSFAGAKFDGDARFERCTFADAVMFRDTEFHGMVNFNRVDIQGSCVFQHANFNETVPGFFGATLPEYTIWHGAEWSKVPTGANQALYQMQAYQRLARMMNGLEKFDDQRMFVRQEMRVRRRVDGWFPVGLMNLAYELICDYGFDLRRAVVLWLAHILSGAAALCLSKFVESMNQGSEWGAMRESFSEFHTACLLSFGNAHGLLDLNDNFFGGAQKLWKDVPWFEGIGAAQTILGVIILFFLLVTIRNRFRMR